MKIIITCGPSYEPIDQARRITNFSTGRLGISLANAFAAQGWEVLCLKGEQATCPDPLCGPALEAFSTNQDLADRLQTHSQAGRFDAVFHAAALCDFKVARVQNAAGQTIASPKFSTREGQLSLVLEPTIKVLPLLRGWFPRARIVGWKYELAGGRPDALASARRQIAETQINGCVVNGAAYGPGFGFYEPAGSLTELPDTKSLAEFLIRWLGRSSTQ